MGCQGNVIRTKLKHLSDKMKFHKIDHNHKKKEGENFISEQRCSGLLCDSPNWTIPFQALAPQREKLRRMHRMCCKVNCLGKLWFIYKLQEKGSQLRQLMKGTQEIAFHIICLLLMGLKEWSHFLPIWDKNLNKCTAYCHCFTGSF